MTIFKINRDARAKNPRHDTGRRVMDHDDIVIHIIQKMRKLGCHLIYYGEDEGLDSSKRFPTIMKFEGNYEQQ